MSSNAKTKGISSMQCEWLGESVLWDPVCLPVVKMTDEVGLLIQPLLVRCQKNENPEVARKTVLDK